MRVAVIGAGAVGSYFGGMLARAGHDVAFLARGENLEALRRGALRVESVKGDFEVVVQASERASEIGPVDYVLVAVKAWQVSEAAVAVPPLLSGHSVVVPMQNGVEAPSQLAGILGREQVVGGFCKILAYMVGAGHVKHAGAEPYIAFGELAPPSDSQRLRRLRDAFLEAGVTCEIPPDITVAMWEKFTFIAATSGVGAMTRLSIGELRSDAMMRGQLTDAIREIVAVGRARGVALPPDAVERTLAYIDSLPPYATASMQRAIMEGRPSELESQTGAIVRLGREAGVPTPVNAAIYDALLPLERRARAH